MLISLGNNIPINTTCHFEERSDEKSACTLVDAYRSFATLRMTRRKGKNKESPSFHINHSGAATHRNDSRRSVITKKWVCRNAHPLSVSSNTGLYSKGSCDCGQYGNDDFNDFLPNAFFFHGVLFFKLVFGFTFYKL